jgi:hypothetical protein
VINSRLRARRWPADGQERAEDQRAIAGLALALCQRHARGHVRDGDHRIRAGRANSPGELAGRQCARSLEPDGDPAPDLGLERGDDGLDVLVGEDSANRDCAAAAGARREAECKRLRGFRVVRDVEDPFRLAGDDLESPRQAHALKAGAHRLVGHEQSRLRGLQYREREPPRCRAGSCRQARAAAARAAAIRIRRSPIHRRAPQSRNPCRAAAASRRPPPPARRGCAGLPPSENRRPAAAEDARLFRSDRLDRVTEPFAMVEPYRHDGGDVGIQDVDGIQPPAHADLEHRDIHSRARKDDEGRERVPLEEGQRDAVARGVDLGECREQPRSATSRPWTRIRSL